MVPAKALLEGFSLSSANPVAVFVFLNMCFQLSPKLLRGLEVQFAFSKPHASHASTQLARTADAVAGAIIVQSIHNHTRNCIYASPVP